MESSWNRAAEHLSLSLEQINELLAPSAYVTTTADLIAEGKANTNYLLNLVGGQKAVLRIFQRDPMAARLEEAVSEALSDQLPVPRVLWLDEERSFNLLEWLPGISIESLVSSGRTEEVESAAYDVGAALATISAITFPKAGFLDASLKVSVSWPSTYDGLYGHLAECLNSPFTQERAGSSACVRIERAWSVCEPVLRAAMAQPCLVHGDYKASNLLIHEGRLSAVLDWEFAHSGSFLMSIGQLLRHESHLPKSFAARFEAGFLDGGGALPERWRYLSKLVDLTSLVDFLSRGSTGEEMTADVIALITETLDD